MPPTIVQPRTRKPSRQTRRPAQGSRPRSIEELVSRWTMLLAVETHVAAHAGHEIPAGDGGEATRGPAGDVAEIGRAEISVNRPQLGRAARGPAGRVDDTGQRRSRDARAAEDEPAACALAARAVVDGHAAVRVGVERKVRHAARGPDDASDVVLVRRPRLELARAAAASAPAGLAREVAILVAMDRRAARRDDVRRGSGIDRRSAR